MQISVPILDQFFDKSKKEINNDIYDEYGEKWYEADNDPVAILRQEAILKCEYIMKVITHKYGNQKLKILDLGCGGGLVSNFLSKQGHEVHGLDISQSSIEIARKYDETRKVKYICGSAYSTPYANKSFDIVLAMDMLEHVEEPETVTREASRVIKDDGLYFYHTFNKNFLSYILVIKIVDWFCPNAHENMHIYRLFIKPETLKKQCEKYKMIVNEMVGSTPCFFSWAFLKSLILQKVDKEFKFKMTSNTLVGYLGFATKIS